MDSGVFLLLKVLLIYCLIDVSTGLTLGHVDRNLLETYEEFSGESEDFDLLGNLSFRFTCENMPIGLYADVEYNCRIFHVCDESGNGFPVVCPNDMYFDQRQRICTPIVEKPECNRAHEWYYMNELPFSGEMSDESKTASTEEDEVPPIMPLSLP